MDNENQNEQCLTLGSLFDGSGGFPLGGSMAGIKPLWASEIEPFPIRVTTKRFPNMKHYGDVSAINGFSISPVDIITFGSPCFPEGTLVLTSEGYLPIEEVTPGMQVLTHQGRWRKVTAAGAKLGETVILKGNHYGLECTPNHPIYSTGERKYYPQLGDGKRGNQTILTDEKKWIPAGEMKGHLWGVPNHADALPITSPVYSSQKEKKCPPLSEKLFYFVGRWLGDGWVRNGQRAGRPDGETYGHIFLCDSYDKEEELIKTVKAVSKRYTIEHTRTCVRIRFCSRVFAEWLTDNFGHYASEKTLPAWVFGMQESWRAALLKGLLDSDGYKMKNCKCEYRITTVSKRLAESIRLLGEMHGYSTTVFFQKTPDTTVIEGRTIRQKDYYTVELARGTKKPHLSDNLHGWYRVRSVTPTHEVKPVYNLTVEEDNSYVADGIVVHNCQDMSIAGKRAGLGGSRSSLFYQAVRIIKEMREATNGKYPRYIVWENVPGAFSSNKGEDFGCVLDEICSIGSTEDIHIARPKKWNHAGYIMGKDYSVAWRTFDALGFGVPQRRKRIYLVGDLDGGSAGKILFESEGMSGYSESGFKAWKEASRCPEIRIGESDSSMCVNDDVQSDMKLFDNHRADCRYRGPLTHAPSVCAYYGTGGVNTPLVAEPYTMRIRCGKPGGGKGALIQKGISGTLGCNNDQTLFQPKAFGICADQSHSMLSENPESGFYEADSSRTIDTIVRRLTPVECCRLQGFPDWWCCNLGTDDPTEEEMIFWRDVFETHRKIVTHASKPKTDNQIRKWLKQPYSDSAAYKMWGNGVALPCVWFVLSGIVWAYKNNI